MCLTRPEGDSNPQLLVRRSPSHLHGHPQRSTETGSQRGSNEGTARRWTQTRSFLSHIFRIAILCCGDPPHRPQARYRRRCHPPSGRHAPTIVDLGPDSDPPKVLAIGSDRAGNLRAVIWLDLTDDAELVIHAMALRIAFYDLLQQDPGRTRHDRFEHRPHR